MRFAPLLTLLLTSLLVATAPAHALEMQRLVPWEGGDTPVLLLKDTQGKQLGLEDFRGKYVLVNFWATWCGPCVQEMPSLQRLRERINADYPDKPLQVLAVNLGESRSKVGEFIKNSGVSFPILLDSDEAAKDAWKIRFVPATFIVGPDGKVRYSYFGDADWASEQMVRRIADLVAGRPQVR